MRTSKIIPKKLINEIEDHFRLKGFTASISLENITTFDNYVQNIKCKYKGIFLENRTLCFDFSIDYTEHYEIIISKLESICPISDLIMILEELEIIIRKYFIVNNGKK